MLRLIAGAILYGLTYRQVFHVLAKTANYGATILPTLWNVDPYLLVAVFVLMVLFLFYLIERGLYRKEKI